MALNLRISYLKCSWSVHSELSYGVGSVMQTMCILQVAYFRQLSSSNVQTELPLWVWYTCLEFCAGRCLQLPG